ncbi:hypothetical protein NLJ89_g1395 [Agrocybe chaxingu]|uniref:GH16 domain-containing protein n=1 Tax=Agrocybe chaxingu TaxID=84603 RepID=A0A9W8N046_9AGAR|nr:hypothetical protein NLJ89_g1395 [Agrocybe chaxingu]
MLSLASLCTAALLLHAYTTSCHAQSFNLAKDYSGSSFFDEWDFYGHWDNLTLGDINWVTRENATAKQLAYVNDAGRAVLRVDTNPVVWNEKRDTVRITSQREYDLGTIWVADIAHMPFGCSVWPALWTKGHTWPDDGEIDIIEGINLNQNNQIALHTHWDPPCTHVDPPPANQRGTSGNLNCSSAAGCTVLETAPNSIGAGFNSAGGGVYATQYDVTGIYIWFWSRPNIPQSILSTTSTSGLSSLADWGPPTASYPAGTHCDIARSFSPQSIVVTITLCGQWAGNPQFYTPQCGGRGPTGICYDDNVVGDGSNYNEAYFEINYIRAYSDPNATPNTVTRSSTATGTTTSPSTTATTTAGGSTGGGTGAATTNFASASLIWMGTALIGGLLAAVL